jgi:CDP-diacylglycerol--glycerol-3-phosphate 3-phosphatidyltransferase
LPIPSIYALKPRFQALLRPATGRLASAGVTANEVTIGAVVLSVAAGLALVAWPSCRAALIAVPAVLLLRMAFNAIDGMLAREHGQQSRLGALLNELGDVISDAALYLPFALVSGVPAAPVVLIVVLGVIGELAGIATATIGASRRYDGPIGKSDRAALFGIIAALLAAGLAPGLWLDIALWLAVALAAATIVARVRRGLSEAGS